VLRKNKGLMIQATAGDLEVQGYNAIFTKKEVKGMERLIRFIKEEEGVTAIEYGLIAALIAVAIILSVELVGTKLNTTFKAVSDKLP
jgi:pilus assembly protein Flp/PilA